MHSRIGDTSLGNSVRYMFPCSAVLKGLRRRELRRSIASANTVVESPNKAG